MNRGFAEFVTGDNSHVEFPDITLTGDYSITCRFYRNRGGVANRMLIGDGNTALTYLWLKDTGAIEWKVNNQPVTSASGILNSDLTSLDVIKVTVTRTSGLSEIFVNDISVAGPTAQANNPTLNRIGSYNTSTLFSFDGIIADVNINGEREYKLDDLNTIAVDAIAGQNGTYVNFAAQQSYTEAIEGANKKYIRADNGKALFYSDDRTKYNISYLGDSIFARLLDDDLNLFEGVMEQHIVEYDQNHNVRVLPWNDGVGSNTIAQIKARLPAILTRFTGMSDVLFLVETGINDNITYGSWATMGGTQQNLLIADLESIVDDVVTGGHDAAILSVPYSGNAVAPDTVNFSLNWTNPVCLSHTPTWYDSGSGRPKIDIEVETKYHFDLPTADYYNVDDIHQDPVGMASLRLWVADSVSAVLNPVSLGQAGARRLISNNPFTSKIFRAG